MRDLSEAGRQTVTELVLHTGFSDDAVAHMLEAVSDGHGRMAQFDHPEFGGRGQWMRGGLTMVSNPFDPALKQRVAGLCVELARLLSSEPEIVARNPGRAETPSGADWWPLHLGRPNAAGSQNGIRYAYFAAARRLAIDDCNRVTLYDTLDHRIGGVAQQQSRDASVRFSSQHGPVDPATLPVVRDDRDSEPARPSPSDALTTIEKLADLHAKGILSADEFAAKKTELLRRI